MGELKGCKTQTAKIRKFLIPRVQICMEMQIANRFLLGSHTHSRDERSKKNHTPCVCGMLFENAEAAMWLLPPLDWGFKRPQLTLTARRSIPVIARTVHHKARRISQQTDGKPADASCANANIPTRSLTHSRRRFLLAKNFARSSPTAQICAVA
jgi:hypothetical protein